MSSPGFTGSPPVPAVMPVPALPRLLRGTDGNGSLVELGAHLREHGPMTDLRHRSPETLIAEIERAGLRGHGGARFPTARKLRAVVAGRGEHHVVVNATEGEPLSRKDRVLLREAPHLVLDGAAVAARAVGARQATIALTANVRGTTDSLRDAIRQRQGQLRDDPRFQVVHSPERFVVGQETALVNFINGGPARPVFGATPYQRGVRGHPTLVQNAETVAHMALIQRHGAAWYRQLGTPADPGSALITMAGAIERPGVYEIEHGVDLLQVIEMAGLAEELRGVLVGGYFGSWIGPGQVSRARLAAEDLRAHGASLGAGVIFVLGRSACPVAETVRVAEWFAGQSAGQCGPCVHGLAAVADAVGQLASGTASRHAYLDLRRWSGEVAGRGACRHPDGAVRFVTSALQTFADEFDNHATHGPCAACAAQGRLPAPEPALLV